MIPVDKSPLARHGNADDFTTLRPEDFGGPHPVPDDYYHDKNHRDSQQIMCWVIIAAIALAIFIIL